MGYVAFADEPSPYPGKDQVEALATFNCAWLREQQGLSAKTYTTSNHVPDRHSWSAGSPRENYATCGVHRIDGDPLPERKLVDPDRKTEDVSVRMDAYSTTISRNPPVGTCVESKRTWTRSIHDVPIVRCDRPHWAEVLGYPTLYEPGSSWPGNDAVYAKAEAACGKVAKQIPLGQNFEFSVNWPAKDWWDDSNQPIYAVCTAHRSDNQKFTGALG